MSDIPNTHVSPQDLLGSMPNPVLRLSALALSVAAMFVPVASVSSFGVNTSFSLTDSMVAGAFGWLLPLAFIAAIAVASISATKRYFKLVDWAVAALCGGLLISVIHAVWSGYNEITQMQNAARAFSGARGQMPSMVDISPSFGLIVLVGLTALSVFTAIRSKI